MNNHNQKCKKSEADQVRFVSEFKMGVNIAFPDEVVKFILA